MQYDIKSAYTEADAAMVAYRTRLKGAYIVVSTGGANPVVFYDNASSAAGNVLLKLGATVAGAHTVVIPQEGILAERGIYCDTGSAASVTLFYG
jgi:hypothetical protein